MKRNRGLDRRRKTGTAGGTHPQRCRCRKSDRQIVPPSTTCKERSPRKAVEQVGAAGFETFSRAHNKNQKARAPADFCASFVRSSTQRAGITSKSDTVVRPAPSLTGTFLSTSTTSRSSIVPPAIFAERAFARPTFIFMSRRNKCQPFTST